MGAEFLSCSYCGEGFSDYDAGWTSCRCGRDWCSPECAEADGYRCLLYTSSLYGKYLME